MNQLTIDALIAAAVALDHPTEGDFALSLWIALSGHYGPDAKQAATVYRLCGYEPFQGYPLTRINDRQAA